MWQLFALASVFSSSIDKVIDKFAIVKERSIDTLIATVQRILVFYIFALLLGVSGIFGEMQFVFPWQVIVIGILWAPSTYFHTYLLKRIEVSVSDVIHYITPFAFLLIDLFILGAVLGAWQIVGILLLPIGGFIFLLDHHSAKLRLVKEVSKKIWFIFLYNITIVGLGSYTFKHLNATQDINNVSYIASVWAVVMLLLLLSTVVKGKTRKLVSMTKHDPYIRRVVASKFFDLLAYALWLQALTGAVVSRVEAMKAFGPITVLLLAYIAQKFLRDNVDEDIRSKTIHWKIIGLIIIMIGGLLAT